MGHACRVSDLPPDPLLGSTPVQPKECFVVSPIGADGSPTRRRSDQVLKYVVEDVVARLGYSVVRADRIADAGRIDSQLLEHVVSADLVVADLSGANPNVFYELAVRHALAKPFVQLCHLDDQLPFDIQGLRTIFFDHTDLDSVDRAKADLRKAVEAVEKMDKVETPLSITVDLACLRSSGDPERQAEAQMLNLLQDIHRRTSASTSRTTAVPRPDYDALRHVITLLVERGQVGVDDLQKAVTDASSAKHDAWVRDLQRQLVPPPTSGSGDDPWCNRPTGGGWSDDPPF